MPITKIYIFFLLLLPFNVFGQKYITAGGVRMSNEGFGLTVQQRLFEHATIEGIAMTSLTEGSIAGLLELHNNLLFTKSLNTYIGLGPLVGTKYFSDTTYLGADVVLGLEYKILLLPIVVSADIKPTFRFDNSDWFNLGVGISMRYVFIKDKKKLTNFRNR